ncbi:MAG: GNAT family protein [Phenylobacterium sp.]|uniref:GNAT family N-acetyltransferase n=1 Tax=Phenylobacterium sp. TaxID=1871053 RepID=UPI0027356732|nr:GNAT family protein [Phenylobacterium sp.]MDP3173835.1 GNAT family protein [Phenylobacterium sp.]
MGFPTDRAPILETARLRLEPQTVDDADALFPILRDPASVGIWGWAQVEDPERAVEIVSGQAAEARTGRALHWTIRSLANDTLTGCCDLTGIDRKLRRAELGFLLGPAAKNQGHGLEALQAVVVYAATRGIRRLQACAPLGARAAETLIEALGFSEVGVLRGQVERDGERRDGRLYSLTL